MSKILQQIRLLLLAIAFAGMAIAVQAKEYVVDPVHSSIGFSIRHLVTNVNGRFTDFKGTIDYDEATPENSSVKFTARISSINTQNEKRDADLRSSNFFDAEKFPEATFVSRKVIMIGKNKAKLIGDLTIHGITKSIVFDVDYLGEAKSPWGDLRAGFSAATTLDRRDFGIVWNKVLDNGGLLVGDEVKLHVDVEAILQCRMCEK